jgi:hypothetical protein
MSHFEFYELPPEAKDHLSRLRWQIAGNQMLLAWYRLEALLAKANFNPDQPRIPTGNADGGQWTGAGRSNYRATDRSAPSRIWSRPPPSLLRLVADKGSHPPGEPPQIPVKKPDSGNVRNTIIKRTVRFLVGAASAGSRVSPYVWGAIEAASWAQPYITAYFDKPKTLEELQRAASEPETGYDIHHLVERVSATKVGFPKALIENPENLVRISTLKHWEVNAFFETADETYGGLTPREYLRNPNIGWEERVRIGKRILAKAGVLKP